ncbi:hypothetical protein [Rufibacter roseus]|uniref:Uncharacterized protein n=1 Tax=Rufibacter roseus TaxID=1567108 RepID=A0ABW2DTZ2_9BACT|nr:hypothetical protein [Rufibacter roseus]
MKKLLSLLVLLSVFLSSCEDEVITLDPDKTGHAYYPLEVGHYWVFSITETTYRNNVGQTTEFQIRERIDETTVDQSGREWYRVEISRRENESDRWKVQDVMLLSKSASDFRITKNNQTLVHMVYPAQNGKTWIYNPLNTSETKEFYSYEKIGDSFSMGSNTYDNTLTIVQADTVNLLFLNEKHEVLSFGVGPVYRMWRSHKYCDGDTGVNCEIGTGYIVTGTEREEVLIETGVED